MKHLCFNLRKADFHLGLPSVVGTAVEPLKTFSGVILTPEMGNLVSSYRLRELYRIRN